MSQRRGSALSRFVIMRLRRLFDVGRVGSPRSFMLTATVRCQMRT